MRYSIILFFAVLISLTSCREDFNTVASSGKLEFSKNTVYLDTVFTNISSSTYTLKVYNKSEEDINIPTISLGKADSKYRMTVDGQTGFDADNSGIGDGKLFKNIEILANDSLYVFIEATAGIADANPTDLLYTDDILFDNGVLQQKVNLVTLIQDAVFLYPERTGNPSIGYTYESLQIGTNPANRIRGFFLDDSELTFTKDKPYVIYGYAAVPAGKVLNIQAGARVHFHDASGIIVANTGSIQVNGTTSTDLELLENEVIFEGDRLEPEFSETPGQWGTILLTEGSINNVFNNLTIKNASVGLFIQKNAGTVQIKNTQIYNSSNVGILARTGKIYGENVVINNAGQFALACTLGGDYEFRHCTFANYWRNGSRQTPSVLVDNTFFDGETTFVADLVQAKFYNSIIFGSNNIELSLNKNNGALFNNIEFKNCFIKFNDFNNQLANNVLYQNVFNAINNNIKGLNQNDPKFKNTNKNNFRIALDSPAKAKGNGAYLIVNDADGKLRTSPSNPDLGAYEHLLQ
jgi:hypothetical protein